MKLLNKLALATAVAALSTASFAMEAMTDDSMAATTGQDGINLQINTSAAVTADSVLIHDNDGFAGAADAGAIILNGLSITGTGAGAPGTSISADIDAGSNGGAATLQIALLWALLQSRSTVSKLVLQVLMTRQPTLAVLLLQLTSLVQYRSASATSLLTSSWVTRSKAT